MIKKGIVAGAILSATLLITGCNGGNDEGAFDDTFTNNENNGYDMLSGNEIENYNPATLDENQSNNATSRFGYVRYNEDQLDQNSELNRAAYIDREKSADLITRMILRTNGYTDAATLVTDKYVLIAYTPKEGTDQMKSADSAKKTALSVIPAYYEIFVSEKPQAYDDIASLSNSSTRDGDYQRAVEQVVDRMKESPQGEEINFNNNMGQDDKYNVDHHDNNQNNMGDNEL